jgi:hypothetical protein
MMVSYGEVKIAKLRLDGEELKMITGKSLCVFGLIGSLPRLNLFRGTPSNP